MIPAAEHAPAVAALERDRRKLRPGSIVALKELAVARLTKNGAFTRDNCERMKVVSVHGDQLKVTTLKGESLGLIQIDWFDMDWIDDKARAAAGGRR